MKITIAYSLLLTAIIASGFSTQAVAANTFKNRTNLSSDTSTNVAEFLRLQLALDSINTDNTYIGFDPKAKTQYSLGEDAPYFQGYGKIGLCSISSDNVLLAINRMPLPGKQSLTINLSVNATADGIYKLNMLQISAIPDLYEIWLMDTYKKDSLDMRKYKSYAFNISKSDKNSYGLKRFSLVIRQNPALGVHLLNFTAAKASDGAQIDWKTENESNYTNFAVEKSGDAGVTFDILEGFTSSSLGSYSYLDKNPAPNPVPVGATEQYRLKITDINGTISFSDVVTLTYGKPIDNIVKNSISIYPNPARNTLNLTITPPSHSNSIITQSLNSTDNASSGGSTIYSIRIFSYTGAILKTDITTQQDWTCDVSNLSPGTYLIQILNNTDKSLIGTSKFIKQ